MIDSIRVGEKIATCRKALNLSQEDLANQVYVTRQALSKWENGTSFPSIDLLLELTKVFKISFEELLCLTDHKTIEIDENDIFGEHERGYIINKILNGEIKVNIPEVFYQLSPFERMTILKGIKENRVFCKMSDLVPRLTESEKKFILGEKMYEIQKSIC